ncbi:hypothetical protein T06_7824, partial [Trichinella sp. T6]
LKDIGCFKWVPLRLYSKVPSGKYLCGRNKQQMAFKKIVAVRRDPPLNTIMEQMKPVKISRENRIVPPKKELSGILLQNLLNSPADSALLDYHLFSSLSSVVLCVSFNNNVYLKTWFREFFESRLFIRRPRRVVSCSAKCTLALEDPPSLEQPIFSRGRPTAKRQRKKPVTMTEASQFM